MIYPLSPDLHLLLIDDQNVLDRVISACKTQGVKTTLVTDGERGYARAIALRPDAILLCLPLRASNGLALLQMIKANHATEDIPVLVLSLGCTPQERVQIFRHGAIDHIQLPARSEEILARVAIHLKLAGRLPGEIQPEHDKQEEETVESQGGYEILVNAARAYIHDHLGELSNTRTIALHLGVSDRRLATAFRAQLDLTPFEYVRRKRMERAEMLLRTTPLNLRDLATEVGYSSAANLVTAFREYYGKPPAHYRREKAMAHRRRSESLD